MRGLLVALVLVLLPRLALADAATAKRAYERGTAAYNLQQFDEALQAFSEAYRQKQVPDLLFNVAQCQRQLGQYDAAAKSYRAFLSQAPGSPNAANAERLQAQMEEAAKDARARAAQPPTGTVAPAPAVETTAPVPRPSPPPAWYANPAGWTLLGVGVAGLAVGGGLLAHGNSLDSDIAGAGSLGQIQSLQNDRDHYRTGGYVALGVGAGLAVAGGIVLGVVGAKRSRARATWVAFTGHGMAVGGAF